MCLFNYRTVCTSIDRYLRVILVSILYELELRYLQFVEGFFYVDMDTSGVGAVAVFS